MLTTETFEIKRLLTLSLAALCRNREEIPPLWKEMATTSTLPSNLIIIVIVSGIYILWLNLRSDLFGYSNQRLYAFFIFALHVLSHCSGFDYCSNIW